MPSADKISFSPGEDIRKIALWVAVASILQISESLLPHPVPGLRFGFANVVSLIILATRGFRVALTVSLLRTIVSSLILGNFMSPGFILSFSGSLLSMMTMGACFFISQKNRVLTFSLPGCSVAGAFVHNMVQLFLAYVLIIRHPGVFSLIPWLSLGAVLMGLVSGFLAQRVVGKLADGTSRQMVSFITDLKRKQDTDKYREKPALTGTTFIYRIKTEYKLCFILLLTFIMLFVMNIYFYFVMMMCLVVLYLFSLVSLREMLKRLKKIWVILAGSFLLPLFFDHLSIDLSGDQIDFYLFSVSGQSLLLGCVFVLRLVVLFMAAHLLSQTSGIEQITSGLSRIIGPLRFIGIDPAKPAEIISLSFHAIPELWTEIRMILKNLLKGKRKNARNVMNAAVELFVYIFQTHKL